MRAEGRHRFFYGKVARIPAENALPPEEEGLAPVSATSSLSTRQEQKVVIKIDSTQVKGMPHRRFNGLVGVVKETGRRAVVIDVKVGDKVKTVISRKEHIVPLLEAKQGCQQKPLRPRRRRRRSP